jgi:hypothetical protein
MKLTARRNQCQSCKEYFNSTGAFEKHRTGKFGVDRRCRTPHEMLEIEMLVNSSGFWITEKFDGHLTQDEPHQSDSAEAHNEQEV